MTLSVTYLGHATVLLRIAGTVLLTDPVLTRNVTFIRRVGSQPEHPPMPDAVLISHGHHDHLHRASMVRLSRGVPILVPRGLGSLVRAWGFASVVEMEAGESVRIGDATVTAVRAEHSGYRPPSGPQTAALGFVITGGDRSVYFAGDTDLFDEMADVIPSELDVALVPVWGWGPRLGPGHLDPERAAEAVARLRPGVVIPIHWGTLWPAGMRWRRHHLTEPPLRLVREVRRRRLPSRVEILEPAETYVVPQPEDAA